jgi:N-formylglutamate amidohydrolase
MQILVIARVAEGVSVEQVQPHISAEAAAVWHAYAAEMLRTIHYIADMSGAVLLFEAPSMEEVVAALPKFPMIAQGLLNCEVIALKPYVGLASLFAQS